MNETICAESRRAEKRAYNRAYYHKNKERRAAQKREYYKANRENVIAKSRAYYAAHPEKVAARQRKYKYGITQEQFDAMLSAQDFKCAVCGSDQPGSKRDWCLDHCHLTGTVRGILCHGCNIGLGGFKDDPAALHAAISYLGRFSH